MKASLSLSDKKHASSTLQRFSLAVAQTFGLSRRAAREAVRSGRVDVDGAAVDEPGRDVPAGARLSFDPARPQKRRVRSRLPVLHEDGDILIVDKPAGLLTVPTEDREKDTAWSRALQYLQQRYGRRHTVGQCHVRTAVADSTNNEQDEYKEGHGQEETNHSRNQANTEAEKKSAHEGAEAGLR